MSDVQLHAPCQAVADPNFQDLSTPRVADRDRFLCWDLAPPSSHVIIFILISKSSWFRWTLSCGASPDANRIASGIRLPPALNPRGGCIPLSWQRQRHHRHGAPYRRKAALSMEDVDLRAAVSAAGGKGADSGAAGDRCRPALPAGVRGGIFAGNRRPPPRCSEGRSAGADKDWSETAPCSAGAVSRQRARAQLGGRGASRPDPALRAAPAVHGTEPGPLPRNMAAQS